MRTLLVLFLFPFLAAYSDAQTKPNFSRDYVYGPGGKLALTVEPDVYAPTTPTNLTATADYGNCVINLAWTASSDIGSGVSGYNVYRGSTLVGTSTTTSYQDPVGPSGKTYTYYVSAHDAAGNTSGQATRTLFFSGCPLSPQGHNVPQFDFWSSRPSGTASPFSWTGNEPKLLAEQNRLFFANLAWLQRTKALGLLNLSPASQGGGR